MKKRIRALLERAPGLGPMVRQVLQLRDASVRLAHLEARISNHRWFEIEEILGYLVGAQLPGDYCEFGVFQGTTFAHCLRHGAPALPNLRYFAFDSFQGLPRPRGVDAVDGFSSNFHEGEFACDEASFWANLRRQHVDVSRVIAVAGWFDRVLNDETAQRIGLDKIAAAWIDGDLYESCVPVLAFLTPRLSTGSVIAFDDWRGFRNLPDRGEQRACAEWLAMNPQITLRPLFSFGHYGQVFTVELSA